MFFNLHHNAIIGYKLLSNADLGISSGNTTHIGLLSNSLNFISKYHQETSSQLIYNETVIEVIAFLDYIENPDGSFRSPKIRSASTAELIQYPTKTSVVRKIREIVSTESPTQWFLLWFALDNEELVFLLIRKNSSDYHEITDIIGQFKRNDTIQKDNLSFTKTLNFLNTKVNQLNFSYIQELELLVQANKENITSRKYPRRYDIDKAQKLFQEIGKKGEELVNIYLEKEKYNNQIKNFNWVNKNNESGFPFDFEITDNNGSIIYSDAKSTSYKFEQKMVFSSQELKFIQQNNNYLIHRVFNLNERPKLRICRNIETVSHDFVKNLNNFNQNIKRGGLTLNSTKVSIPPTHNLLRFNNEITL
ncbi:MAG: DUF3883 domain-containing protein [uncultured Sulfurovum sp.]|uniref:DUF3883 domain-containing protein n=1 Tax=uncultured Sulfurovum sp. TaxID=269237 RepID=A0A6S6SPQ2_9BACT|nr:MAG: DUF3883 domain-containing protein [uncultured Sulfurovum sp.]